MAKNYTPRRASRRWLEGAPRHVLDVLDAGERAGADRYTILYTFPLAFTCDRKSGRVESKPGAYGETFIPYLGTSASLGVSGHGEMTAHEAAMFRYRNKHRRIRWADLPAAVQAAVISDGEEESDNG